MSLPNPDATLLDILSPPKSTSTDDRYARIAGRFGYQMCVDIIAFAQNLPQRLLLIDQLQKLPELFFELLLEENMQQVIRKVIDSDQIPVWTIEEVQDHIERSYTQLEKIAQHAWVSAKNCRNINTT